MSKQLFCGSSCIKYILKNYNLNTNLLKPNMIWISELALSLKKSGLSTIEIFFYNSRLYTDFINNKENLNFDGFKYLKELQEQKIQIKEKELLINSFFEEIDNSEF